MSNKLFLETQVKTMCKKFKKKDIARELCLFYLAFNVSREAAEITKTLAKLQKIQKETKL